MPNFVEFSKIEEASSTTENPTTVKSKSKFNSKMYELNVEPFSGNLFDIGMLPEPQRRAQNDPMKISLKNRNSNSDIYFIGINFNFFFSASFIHK